MIINFLKYDFKNSAASWLDTDICFITVPTPSRNDGSCNVGIVAEVVGELNKIDYKGIVALKSTVEPGTTNNLQLKYPNLDICFVPEFLRERCATDDFVNNHDLCVVGTSSDKIFELVKEVHGEYPKKIVKISEIDAEFCKYFNNSYNATLVTFAYSFYELCKKVGADYDIIKDTMINRAVSYTHLTLPTNREV